ncbi:MAG TPA: FGGY family carbohydrate kinase, partial [Clostridia bacterium]|nr:FGGY family carbohydrate kinase [Clostridia bacterium]
SKEFFANGYASEDIIGIVMSGQMQDLIPVDKDGLPVGNAVLYSDGRAGKQACEIAELVGLERIVENTGNNFDGSMPFAKLLWLKQNRFYEYGNIKKVLISSKDYVVLRLTGCFISDVTAASTAGLMGIHNKHWNIEWTAAVGIDGDLLPDLLYAEEQAGLVTDKAALETGYRIGTPVYAGAGDAGATTLASGIAADGEFNINLGTSGWVACVSEGILQRGNVFNLAAMPRNAYINVVPFFNAGNVHKWISKTLAKDNEQDEKYEYIDRLLEQSVPGSHGLMFLPYLTGERFPVVDTEIRGGFAGITPETTKQDMARACLEGVAFSIRQGIAGIGRRPTKISLIGGGALVKLWCQIFADILDHEVLVYDNSEFLPAVAIAAAVLIAQGKLMDYNKFTESLRQMNDCTCYKPDPQAVELYNKVYGKYCSIYPALKTI